jgi:hypothetical protein
LESSETALEILKCCDGATSVRFIVDDLANAYKAPRDEPTVRDGLGDVVQTAAEVGLCEARVKRRLPSHWEPCGRGGLICPRPYRPGRQGDSWPVMACARISPASWPQIIH